MTDGYTDRLMIFQHFISRQYFFVLKMSAKFMSVAYIQKHFRLDFIMEGKHYEL